MKLLFPFSNNDRHEKVRIVDRYWKFGFQSGGKDIIDLGLGLMGCFMLGFDRDDIIEHVTGEMKYNPFSSGESMTTNQKVISLTDKLYDMSNGYNSVFALSGSDSVETAVKVAKLFHGYERTRILGVKDSYHGSTHLTTSIGGMLYMNNSPDLNCLALDEWDILDHVKNSNPAALITESRSWNRRLIQMDKRYWLEVRDVCRDKGIMFVIDDIAMCGGKTDTFFGFDPDLKPDMFCMGKALTGGFFPLSVCMISDHVKEKIQVNELTHGFTYGFNMSGIYSTSKYLDILEKEKILENQPMKVEQTKQILDQLKQQNLIIDYRNHGLLFNIDTKNQNENIFFDNGLNLALSQDNGSNLSMIIPLTADDEYYSKLKNRLIASLK